MVRGGREWEGEKMGQGKRGGEMVALLGWLVCWEEGRFVVWLKKRGGVKSLQMDREGSGGAKLAMVAIEGRESSLPKWRRKSRESAGHWSA